MSSVMSSGRPIRDAISEVIREVMREAIRDAIREARSSRRTCSFLGGGPEWPFR